MARERLPVYADLLLKEDLCYELQVRGVPFTNLPVYDLLSLYRQNEKLPVLAENVQVFLGDGLTSLERKVEQVSELIAALAEGVPSEKQVRRCRAKLNQACNRVQDAIHCGKFSGDQLKQSQDWFATLCSLSVPGEASSSELCHDQQNIPEDEGKEIPSVVPVTAAAPVEVRYSPVIQAVSQPLGTFNSNNSYAKLPHPLAQLLNQAGKYNVSSLENTLAFLLFLDTVASHVRILALDVRPILASLFSKLAQPLADLVGSGLLSGYDIDRLHDHVLRGYVPERARVTLMERNYYRVQRVNEPLNEYVREIKTYARILRVTSVEKEVVDNILSGLSPGVRSALNFELRPVNFAELDALCIRVTATLYADTVRGSLNQMSKAPRTPNVAASMEEPVQSRSSRGVICYRCRAPGHVVRNCPGRGRPSRAEEAPLRVDSSPVP